ncbi:MAG: hypothetical protein K0R31_161 [Clostridiales bacterium]|jgi:peptidoglycan/LPS O-acetylase OafA/YrhL|nr:hypothetical protein [Clostridiales bacterium]
MDKSKRYIELDSLRGLASLTVFFSHAVNMLVISGDFFKVVSNSVLHIFWDGAAAVILFFVLSGFVLTLPFVGKVEREPEYFTFIIKRIFRIYPAYFFALFFAIVIKTYFYNRAGIMEFSEFVRQFWGWKMSDLTIQSIIKHMLMIGPRYEMGQIDPIIWSLVVEMKISVLFPFVILLVKELRSAKTGVMLFLGTVLAYKLSDKGLLGRLPFLDENVYHYFSMFLMGALLAKYKDPLIEWVRKTPPIINIFIFAVGIVLYTGRYSLHELGISYGNYNYVVSVGVGIILIYVIALPQRFKVLTSRPIKLLGDISYSMYLLHFPILMTVTSIIYAKFGSIKISYAVSLVLTLVLSYISYKWIELPFQNMGRSLAKKLESYINNVKQNDIKSVNMRGKELN